MKFLLIFAILLTTVYLTTSLPTNTISLKKSFQTKVDLLVFAVKIGQVKARQFAQTDLLKELEAQLSSLEEFVKDLEQDLTSDKDLSNKLELRLKSIESSVKQTIKKLDSKQSQQSLLGMVDILLFGAKLGEWDAKNQSLTKLANEFTSKRLRIEDIERDIRGMASNVDISSKFEAQLKRLEVELKDGLKRLELQKVRTASDRVRQSLLDKAELLLFGTKLGEWDAKNNSLNRLANEFTSKRLRIEDIERDIRGMTSSIDINNKFEAQLKRLEEELNDGLNRLEVQKVKTSSQIKANLLAKAELLLFGAKLGEYEAKNNSLSKMANEFTSKVLRVQDIERQVRELTTDIEINSEFEDSLNKLESELNDALERLEELKVQNRNSSSQLKNRLLEKIEHLRFGAKLAHYKAQHNHMDAMAEEFTKRLQRFEAIEKELRLIDHGDGDLGRFETELNHIEGELNVLFSKLKVVLNE